MLKDKWLAMFLALMLFSLALVVPGVAEMIAALVTGIPNFWGFVAVCLSTLAFGVRYFVLVLRPRRRP